MRSSGFVVRKFRSAALERAFRMDYARRFAGQRRLAATIFTLLWIYLSVRDMWRLDTLDPSNLYHIAYLRFAAAMGMAVPVWLLWGRRALDERWAVGLLFVWTLSCWFATLRLIEVVPVDFAWRAVFPILTLVLFMIFTSYRLRAITATWLVGLCVVMFHLTLYLWPRGHVTTQWADWISRGTMIPMTYLIGVVVSIPLERAARREFMSRRTLRAAKARVEAQNERMRELIKEKERFFSSAYHDI